MNYIICERTEGVRGNPLSLCFVVLRQGILRPAGAELIMTKH